jgi:hypothetical protein
MQFVPSTGLPQRNARNHLPSGPWHQLV